MRRGCFRGRVGCGKGELDVQFQGATWRYAADVGLDFVAASRSSASRLSTLCSYFGGGW